MEVSEAERQAVLGHEYVQDAGVKGTLMDGIANVSGVSPSLERIN